MSKKNEIRSVIEEFIGDKLYNFLDELDTNEVRDDLKERLYGKGIKNEVDYTYTYESKRMYGDKYKELFQQELTEYLLDKFKEHS